MIRPVGVAIHELVGSQWDELSEVWERTFGSVVTDPSSNFTGTQYYKTFNLFIGDPAACGVDDPATDDPTVTPPTVVPDGGGGNMGTIISPRLPRHPTRPSPGVSR